MKRSIFGPRRTGAIALVVVGLVIGVTMMATPAVGHVGGTVSHLWNQHIKPKADARYARAVQVVQADGNTIIVSTVQQSTGTASCPSGKKVLGGGAEYQGIFAPSSTPSIVYSKPVTTAPQGWTAQIEASSNEDWSVRVYAVCAKSS